MATPARLQGKTVGELREAARWDAQAVLAEHWPDIDPPVDPVTIARKLGASVFVAELGDDVYGMVQGDATGTNIYVDRESPAVRRRFTVAHEVGHIVSYQGDLKAAPLEFVDARSDQGSGSAAEVYANEFAAELLMPREHLERALRESVSDFTLAARYGVSLQALRYRRQLLNL